MRMNDLGRSIAAGLCGGAAHFGLMYLKARTGLLPSFQPYQDLQRALAQLVGEPVHPALPWVLSFMNGAVVLGFLGRGLFATQAGLGLAPAAFSLAMVLAYSVTMGVVYALLKPKRASGRPGAR
jgi:hypothetical protein